ncbi:restriction endonuclease subunit S [Pasteurella atlantica]|uniref:restriction endonuclease subunit S n=1 Tax=Pasteurellaceae TaxID=712 RepID=UPI0027622A9B|nr:restriction endonuclease subunit S [Pasteurella atlantica]MDP8033000.1 restriction endonuclease subunit S [Pasteurella atlantica]MDP8034843.1 restriction endonuclease subunit S [Pasteurella atlantica]MDP8036887.1 restriction endonuclease subunit S [Pasteurella atlantica]MDP8047140.1 restriction endonuclease subunit S [Pasteurella atlantica]MDP8049350.1 restriction endonuclease subunit S [Pasteurella atlantica]
MGDVIYSLNTGLNPRRFFQLNTEDAINFYITIKEIRNGSISPTEKTDRINDEALKLCNNRSNLEIGDILFSGTGTIGETAVIKEAPTNWNIKEGVYAIKPKADLILSDFLRFLFTSSHIRSEFLKKAEGGTVKSISMKTLKKSQIPLPKLDEQERIVKILDKFDRLTNSITEGLPKEIDLRQKQYEYYRDLLLNFDK